MDDKMVQENPVPNNSEKDKLRENIISMSENISASYIAIRIVGVLLVIAAFFYAFAGAANLSSPFFLPVLLVLLVGNQVYLHRTRRSQGKRDEMTKTYESKFGVFTSN